jgi:formylglycine-generating enzyme required for sulfatase activity
VGVTSEPDHLHVTLHPSDAFMVLASDGVWEFITSQEAVELVASYADIEDGCRAVRARGRGQRTRAREQAGQSGGCWLVSSAQPDRRAQALFSL